MTKSTLDHLTARTRWMHSMLLKAVEPLDESVVVQRPGPTAPPIGWHLWHMARWIDRLQARLATVIDGGEDPEIWYRDGLAQRWALEPGTLGVFDSGVAQEHDAAAATVTIAGKTAIVAYAQNAIHVCNQRLNQLTDDDLDRVYAGLLNFDYDLSTGSVWAIERRESTVAQDLFFHISHGSRHLGMMEALRGLHSSSGTVSL